MKQGFLKVGFIILGAILGVSLFGALYAHAATGNGIARNLAAESTLVSFDTTPPALDKPEWYQKQVELERLKAANGNGRPPVSGAQKTITYSVTLNGAVRGGYGEFSQQANATLNDPRGWSQLNVRFVQVASGGQFTLVLSQASLVPSYSPAGCSAEWSCAVGRNVIINDDRWMGATTSWNQAGGTLREYRHMVINHEVGHWLGHGHTSCGGAGQQAAVMQQQSMGLQGCTFNPWPVSSEIWSSRI